MPSVEKTQSLKIYQGTFYTEGRHKVIREHPHTGPKDVIWVADRVGCDVVLERGDLATLEYGPQDNRRHIEFRGSEGMSYEIRVKNNRRSGTVPHEQLTELELAQLNGHNVHPS